MPKRDIAREQTDEALADLEKRISRIYADARDDMSAKVDEYFSYYRKREEHQRELLKKGEITEEQFKQWRLNQMGRGERFEVMRDKLADRMTRANEVAAAYINDETPSVYSLNRNYTAYTIDTITDAAYSMGDTGSLGIDFTLWNEDAVKRLIVERPDLMPYYPPERAVKRGIDLAWGKKQITAQVTSGILQGESIKHLADRLQNNIPDMNRHSAIRAARTAVTGAENAGRQDTYEQAAKMGIKVQKRWVAVKDNRTRHEHGMADGQTVDIDKPFNVDGYDMMFPGDTSAPAHLIYNCRCGMRTVEKPGIEAEPRMMRVRDANGRNVLVKEMTYTEWQEWVKSRGG